MKNICFESYRQSKRDKTLQAKPKPKQLDSTWYTDNIYSNRSEDLEDDYVPDCLKYGTHRKLRNIREQDEIFESGGIDGMMGHPRGEGEGSPSGYALHRSRSCREFHYPKSQSCCFESNAYILGGQERENERQPSSILKKTRTNVPKSYSFSATTKTAPFDVMDYDLPPIGNIRREKQEAFRKSMQSGYWSNSLDENALSHSREFHTCCAHDHCVNAKSLVDNINSYPNYNTGYTQPCRHGHGAAASYGGVLYGADVSGDSNRNLHATDHRWLDEGGADSGHQRMAPTSRYLLHHHERGAEQHLLAPAAPMTICCCAIDDYCYHRQQQHHIMAAAAPNRPQPHPQPQPRYHCPGHHPAAEEEEHLNCRAVAYDTDVDDFIRNERERLLLQDKFLDDDERYLAGVSATASVHDYRRPLRRKPLPPSRYDDSCSDTTDIDLEDFNIDLEKYWEELEKPPSPIDLDMQRRNMHSNLKVKNVNVGCYNNGQPIDLHDREQERMLIKKSLLEGMPSPPQVDTNSMPNNSIPADYHFFEQPSSPLHRAFNYNRYKVYPAMDSLPTYKYNNFYPDDGTVQTQQPISSGHHTAAGGHTALSLINNIFSIYKPNKYAPHNCHQLNMDIKPDPIKKMNVPSTRRPLGAPHSEYMHSMKRPLIVSTDQPHFKIIPEKTGLKISPLYSYDEYGEKPQTRHKLTSTARPLMLPH